MWPCFAVECRKTVLKQPRTACAAIRKTKVLTASLHTLSNGVRVVCDPMPGLKTLAVVAALVWVGRRMPVLRPDRTVEVGWMVLVPLTLLQALVVAVLVLNGFYA